MLSFPTFVFTLNCFVTSFPSASFTTAVPSIVVSYSPKSVPSAFDVNPETVYFCLFTVNSVVSKPAASCSLPSYVAFTLLAVTVISNLSFSALSVTSNVPFAVVIV